MPKGEKVLAQSKRTAPPFQSSKLCLEKIFKMIDFSIGILLLNFSKSYSFISDYLAKDFEKNFQKSLQKQNKWCKHGP
jgi:hypothetical protein